jgi:putative membrane protein
VAEFPAWSAHIDVWLVMIAVEAAYLFALRRLGPAHREPREPAATRRQITLFSTGVGIMLVSALWPMHDLAERSLYSVHMLQHMLLTLIAPALLIRGMPDWLLRKLLRPVMPVARIVLRPAVAFVIFNAVLVTTHWPALVNMSVGNEWMHFGLHVILVGSGLIMWWPVLSPLAELPRLSYPGQMIYLFLQSILPTVPASFLTFGSKPLYHVYETFPRLWGISALDDMRVAGLLMKVGGGAILWTVVAMVWFKWARSSEKGTPDSVEWQSVEREINRIGSRPR